MVFIEDRGSVFGAPLEIVWKYLFDGEAHDKIHKSTRNSSFKPISKTSFVYSAERNFNGNWIPESVRQSVFPPLGMSTVWLEGPFAGSKMFYLYSPKGNNRTQIDVFGDFQSKTLSEADLEQRVKQFLEGEFSEDAPAVREYSKRNKVGKKESSVFFKDLGVSSTLLLELHGSISFKAEKIMTMLTQRELVILKPNRFPKAYLS